MATRKAKDNVSVLAQLEPDDWRGEYWFHLTGYGPPLEAFVRRTPAGLVLSGLHVHPLTDEEGITSGTLRAIRFGDLMPALRAELLHVSRALVPLGNEWADLERDRADRLRAAARAPAPSRRRGRPGLGDDHYRRIATRYLDLANQSAGPPGVLQRLADEEGRPSETIRDWVHRARELGFLTKGQPGRVGAEPGPRLHDYKPPRGRGKR